MEGPVAVEKGLPSAAARQLHYLPTCPGAQMVPESSLPFVSVVETEE